MSHTMFSPEWRLSAQVPPHLPQLQQHVLQLFSTYLSDRSMQVMKEKVQILHRSSFYLELCPDESTCPVEELQLPGALRVAHNHVRLLLTLMDMLLEEICCCRQDLQGFLQQTQKGPVDDDLSSTALTTLRQLHKHLQDFNTRDTLNLGPLNLEKYPLLRSGQWPMPQLMALLFYKLPVVFDCLKSHATSTTVHLVWSLYGSHCPEPDELFEVSSNILHPCVGEQDQGEQLTVMGLSYTIDNLLPDRFYQFSVKYASTSNLVFSVWRDKLILKTQTPETRPLQ